MLLSLVVLLHGDMDQFERNKVINSFKKQEIPILVATDVAGKKQSILCVFVSRETVSAPSGSGAGLIWNSEVSVQVPFDRYTP